MIDATIKIDSSIPLVLGTTGLTWKPARTSSVKPEPITKSALLRSEASVYEGRVVITRHVYEETGSVGNGYAHMFRCTRTGNLRRWGFEAFDGASDEA